MNMIDAVSASIVDMYCSDETPPDDWDLASMITYAESILIPRGYLKLKDIDLETVTTDELKETIRKKARRSMMRRKPNLAKKSCVSWT